MGRLKELNIENYRGLSNLKLSDLNKINILTGNNNCGKTSVLELLNTLNDPYSFDVWDSCGRKPVRQSRRKSYYDTFYSLFPIDSGVKKIGFYFTDEYEIQHQISLYAGFFETKVSEAEINQINHLYSAAQRNRQSQIQDKSAECMELRAEVDGQAKELTEIYDFQFYIRPEQRKKGKGFCTVVYQSPYTDHSDLSLNEIFSDQEIYSKFLSVLREYDSDIIDVRLLESQNSLIDLDYRIISKNHKEPLPLNVYGEGMKKAMRLMIAVVKASGGILLMDEFETSIHTSVMDSTFTWLLHAALAFDVQVFLTSHSKEAIEILLNMDEEIQDSLNVYTMFKNDDRNLVRRMTCREALEAIEQLGMDLR